MLKKNKIKIEEKSNFKFGESEFHIANGNLVIRLQDKRELNLLSNIIDKSFILSKTWDKKSKSYKFINIPKSLTMYSKYM